MPPVQSPTEFRTQVTFRALMQALAMPGQVQHLPPNPNALAQISETLVDLETTFFTPDPTLHLSLLGTGALPESASQANYLFFPQVDEAALDLIAQASRGDMLYPDRAATLILATDFAGLVRGWTGPGIQGKRAVSLGLPEGFWTLRSEAVVYPLGWDVFLVSGTQVLGLPRSTNVELM
ncbi:phosphonate C-P lyase system protein PhnH [Deinococcus oregonensis]|uniref:Phosphonate C-P lyase system protein PhnH n=1 Tax=Deinococcus oregonensis TaxID=1805970 RepID=A0ABV6AZL6_9DEIO